MIQRKSIWLMRSAAVAICAAVAASCNFRPMEEIEYNTKIEVDVNIKAVANVTCDIYNELIPPPDIECEVFRVLFFDTKEDRLLSDSFIYDTHIDEQTGQISVRGDINIMPGDYRMIIYTFGTESTLIENYDSWEKATAYTSPLTDAELKTLSLKASEDQLIRYQPDHLLVASSELESIPYHAGVFTITTEAQSIVESYYLQVRVKGAQWISSAKAVLSSMSPSASLNDKAKDYSAPTSIYIDLKKSEDKGEDVVCNVFNTFGRIPESENELKVTFDLMTTDGRKIEREYEISDLFLSEDCINHHWLLIDDTIDVPKPPDSGNTGGGFDPEVVDWENEEHFIEF
ncbi:MAG: DUF5119 domain-containing protein [Candidatus Cryptobacteroides sp.]